MGQALRSIANRSATTVTSGRPNPGRAMSRSNYSEDYDELFPNALEFYRRNVENAISGKRGQAFIRDLIAALDAMPDKRLIAEELERDGAVCAIGSVGKRRGIDMSKLDPCNAGEVGGVFGIATCLAAEVVFENDEGAGYWTIDEAPEKRWQRMRDWAARNLKSEKT